MPYDPQSTAYRPNRPPTPEEWLGTYTLFYRYNVINPYGRSCGEFQLYVGSITYHALFWRIPNESGLNREDYESIEGFTPAKIQECLEELEKIREYFPESAERLDDVLHAQNLLFAELASQAS